jgi:plasmid stability protein
MAALVIKNLPGHLHAKLKLQAQRNHRSLTKEALILLERGIAQAPETAGPRRLSKPISLKGCPPAGSFVKSMLRSPLYGAELDLKREQTPTRKADIA